MFLLPATIRESIFNQGRYFETISKDVFAHFTIHFVWLKSDLVSRFYIGVLANCLTTLMMIWKISSQLTSKEETSLLWKHKTSMFWTPNTCLRKYCYTPEFPATGATKYGTNTRRLRFPIRNAIATRFHPTAAVAGVEVFCVLSRKPFSPEIEMNTFERLDLETCPLWMCDSVLSLIPAFGTT